MLGEFVVAYLRSPGLLARRADGWSRRRLSGWRPRCAKVRAADPLVTESAVISPQVACVDATTDEIAAADAVVLLTDHDAFADSGIGRHVRYVLDYRRALSGPNVETL